MKIIIWMIQKEVKGAPQLIRGPAVEGHPGWVYAASLSTDPHPLGWPVKIAEKPLSEVLEVYLATKNRWSSN